MVDRNKERKPFEIVPIKRVDIYESVLAQLNALITESGMKPGDRLPPERELVEKLGVSRVSVREALRALESMGKIEIRRNAGSFVLNPNGSAFASQLKATHPVDRAFLDYLVEVRAAVEDKVVELVAKRTDADLSAVRAVLERTEAELGESVEQGSLDLRFEASLAREVGNPLLAETQRCVHQLWVEAWSVCRITPGDSRRFHAEHLAILDELERGDGKAARRLMTEHVDRTVENAAPIKKGTRKR
jgi:GntR family transcriptional regulator, transcriptional repressor for pyruvate dehydrogenase complex